MYWQVMIVCQDLYPLPNCPRTQSGSQRKKSRVQHWRLKNSTLAALSQKVTYILITAKDACKWGLIMWALQRLMIVNNCAEVRFIIRKRKQLGRDVFIFTFNFVIMWVGNVSRFLMDDSSSGECSTESTVSVNREHYRFQLRSCEVSLHICFKSELRTIFIFASQFLLREVHQRKRHIVYPGSTTRCNPFL